MMTLLSFLPQKKMSRPADKKFKLANAGREIRLVGELGRGGEGTVYEIQGDASIVAKLYAKQSPQKIAKLKVMPGVATPQLLKVAAWPKDLLLADHGQPVGFIMPRIGQRRDIHELYSPKSRSQSFVEADFRFLVRAALNIAKSFAVIHSHGHVIGDVNHGNLLAGPDATVVLIDCDSFQVQAGSQVHLCDVGSPLFTPPELQGLNLNTVNRAPNHDLFGLAVLIFHILFMGRHPFAGRYLGKGDMPPEKAIAEHRFAYLPNQKQTQMQPPPGTVALDAFGLPIASHFASAFLPQGRQARPSALDWISALEALEKSLRSCPSASWHHFFSGNSSCPWCAIEKSGVRLFGQRIANVPHSAVDLAGIWGAIVSIPDPGNSPNWVPLGVWVPPPDIVRPSGFISRVFRYFGDLPGDFKAEYKKELTKAQEEHESVLKRWRRETNRSRFAEKFNELESQKKKFESVEKERLKRYKELEGKRQSMQLEKYLDRYRLERAKIPGIGESRRTVLVSYGIETAADIKIEDIYKIPGFGTALTQELLNWRKGHEKNFRFNPNEGVDPLERAKLDQWAQKEKIDTLKALQTGVSALASLSQEIIAARRRLQPLLENSWNAIQVAKYKLDNWSGF